MAITENISKSLSRKRARKIWESSNSKIKKGMHLHHKDGNPFNNNINNLTVCTPEEHIELHRELGDKIQYNFIGRADWYKHATEEQKLAHKEYSSRGGKVSGKRRPSKITKEKLRFLNIKNSNKIKMIELNTGKTQYFSSVRKASEILGIQRAHIRRVIAGGRKQWKGFVFRYV